MSKRKSESQIITLLKKAEAGIPVAELCRQEGVSVSTFYSWRAKYGGMEVSEAQRLKELEEENRRLKQMYAELMLDHQVAKHIIEKKL